MLRNSLAQRILLYFLIFVGTFLVYTNFYPNPRTWYDHYKYQAGSFLQGRVDIPNLPEYYQDKIVVAGKIFLPFPPMPSLVLVPLIKINPAITQQSVSVFIGAINAVLVFILLSKFTSSVNALRLTLFFSFGTVAFWSAIVGTTWYYAHTVAIMFMLLSLISFKNKKDFLAGIFFTLAVLSRYPILMGGIFFLLELLRERRRLALFICGAFFSIPAQFLFDYLRFGSPFETGYVTVYKDYVTSSYPYTLMQLISPGAKYFGYIDPRNIPLHLFTFLFYPPVITESLKITPSPYGMGILFTTPLLLLALKPHLKDRLQRNLFIGALFVALIDFMHYMQGWVQFGYRFVLDFMPFLLIILALKFKPKASHILLLIFSIFVSTWGALWGIKLGW
jgi:hypothetical protein